MNVLEHSTTTEDCFAQTLVKPNGEIIFENRHARDLFPGLESHPRTVFSILSAAHVWDELVRRIKEGQVIEDVPVALHTKHNEADVYYLSITPQADGKDLELLCCVWASRRHSSEFASHEQLIPEYTRQLEEIIEQRTYQQILIAEQNALAYSALDALTIGIIVVDLKGDVVFRNRSATDIFGLKLHEYIEHNVRCFLPPEAQETLARVINKRLRAHLSCADPGGNPVFLDFLPLQNPSRNLHIVLQFRRVCSCGGAA